MPSLERRAAVAGGLTGFLGLIASGALVGQGASAQNSAQNRTYEDVFTVQLSDPRFGTWASIVQQSGLSSYARSSTGFTVLTPTNAAFAKYPTIRQDLLPTSSEAFPDTSNLIRFVRSHVVYGLHPPAEFEGKKITLTSAAGTPIEVDATNPKAPRVTWSSVQGRTGTTSTIGQPIYASNGIIYPFDDLILR